jgi:hypothetical protein
LTQQALEQSAAALQLNAHLALLVPVDPCIDGIELLLDSSEATELTVELWGTGKPQNYVPHTGDYYPSTCKGFIRKPICFRLLSPTSAFLAEKAAGGSAAYILRSMTM